MAVTHRTGRSRFTLVLLVLTSLTVITLDFRGGVATGARRAVGDVLAPARTAVSAVLAPVGDAVGGVTRYGALQEENARLRAELEEARGARLRARGAERQRRALLSLQDLEFAGDAPGVAARVVSAPLSNMELVVEIDRGTADGVAAGMPVVTGAGLAGRVVHAGDDRARVLLLSDPTFAVGVRLGSSGDLGVAEGGGYDQPLRVALTDPDTELASGQVVTTSGLHRSRFPPDVPVGVVRTVRAGPGTVEPTVLLDPVADLRRLEFVKVLLWEPPE